MRGMSSAPDGTYAFFRSWFISGGRRTHGHGFAGRAAIDDVSEPVIRTDESVHPVGDGKI